MKIKIMTQEDKELLLKDLCARLPYGVKVQHQHPNYIEEVQTVEHISRKYGEIETNSVLGFADDFKPYLRPLSSMTEEEKVQLSQYACIGEDLNGEFIDEVQRKDCAAYIDWLNKNHFDYRGLIPKGLANEAPEGMYN